MDITFYLICIACASLTSAIITYIFRVRDKRPIVMQCDDWLKIEDHPLPEDIRDFLAYDGYRVSEAIFPSYNSKGEAMLYSRKLTHWMPMPEAPKE